MVERVKSTEKESGGDDGKKKSKESKAEDTKWLTPTDARFVLILFLMNEMNMLFVWLQGSFTRSLEK
jgi:hypothetical protein